MPKQEYQGGSFQFGGGRFPSLSVLDAEKSAFSYIEEMKFNAKYADMTPLPLMLLLPLMKNGKN